jgi:DNA-binding NarL/FixJ family response regulator
MTSSGPILVVDSHASTRASIASVLEHLHVPVVAAATGEQALAIAEQERPAAVVTEVLLPSICGYELCRVLKDRYGAGLPVIFVSRLRTHAADRVAGLLLGADDYLVQPIQPDELLVRVRRCLPTQHHGDIALADLTRREQEVLQLLTDGLDQAEIAERLFITQRTVAKHVEHILPKLGVHTRAQAVAVALRNHAAA